MSTQKKATYVTTNTYHTLNNFTEETKNVWMVFHGMGYLSKYFINYFSELDADENYIIAPQAPSKYYQGKDLTNNDLTLSDLCIKKGTTLVRLHGA